jgi:diguanylate cyclase (GGDEF)-like protein
MSFYQLNCSANFKHPIDSRGNTVMTFYSRLKKNKLLRYLRCIIASIALLSNGLIFASNEPLQQIDFQLRWHHQFQFAGYYAAVEKGFYREAGLDVKLHEAGPGITPVEEVLSGRAQYGESNSEILYARLQGEPVVALAAIFQHSPSVLLARDDLGIRSPHDLIGKKIMLMNARTDADFHVMFLHEGIKADAIDIIPSSFDFEDLLSGKVTAFNSYLTNEPFILNQRGIAYSVINPNTYGIDFYSDILFTTEQELKQHPERVESFRRATLKGWRYAMENPDEIIDLLLTKYHVQKTRAHLKYEADAMRPLILPDLIEIGHMNPGRWRRMADAFIEVGMGKPDISLEGFIYDPNPPHEIEKLKRIITYGSITGGFFLFMTVVLFFGWLRLKKEITRRKSAEEEVRRLAYNDPLTGIPNRNTFIPYANKQLLTAKRAGKKLALCFIDLNDFKTINDNHGHKVGDAALIHSSTVISSLIRESDMVSRIGGDEFVVLLIGINSIEDTLRTSRQIQAAIAQPFVHEEQYYSISASIGISIFPDHGHQLDELITKADDEMYKNKHSEKLGQSAI